MNKNLCWERIPSDRPLLWTGRVVGVIAAVCAMWMAAAIPSPAQQGGTLAGTVVNEASLEPLAGAQVLVEGTGRGTLTDASGRFLLTGVDGTQANLRVQLIGYRPVTRTVQVGATDLRIMLNEQAVQLDEVVVTGTAGATSSAPSATPW